MYVLAYTRYTYTCKLLRRNSCLVITRTMIIIMTLLEMWLQNWNLWQPKTISSKCNSMQLPRTSDVHVFTCSAAYLTLHWGPATVGEKRIAPTPSLPSGNLKRISTYFLQCVLGWPIAYSQKIKIVKVRLAPAQSMPIIEINFGQKSLELDNI